METRDKVLYCYNLQSFLNYFHNECQREELRNTGCIYTVHVTSMSVSSSAFRGMNATSIGINRTLCSGKTFTCAVEKEEN